MDTEEKDINNTKELSPYHEKEHGKIEVNDEESTQKPMQDKDNYHNNERHEYEKTKSNAQKSN